MNAVVDLDISIERFEAADINAERFDHEAHVHMGWLYVRAYELPDALARFDAALRRLLLKLGAESKYHMTLTWFFLLLISERSEANESWRQFNHRNPDLVSNSAAVLSRYYSKELLFSGRARQRFVLPDNIAA